MIALHGHLTMIQDFIGQIQLKIIIGRQMYQEKKLLMRL